MRTQLSDLVHNERTKLLAGNLDRASTAAIVGGFITPGASLATGSGGPTFTPLLLLSTVIWLLAAVALHYAGRWVLGGLRA